jgi:hypothetical protein
MKIVIKLGDGLWFDNFFSVPDCTTVIRNVFSMKGPLN